MTRHEFKTIRRRLGYSQAGLARVLGLKNGESVRKFEEPGEAHRGRDISGVISRLMRIYEYLGREETDQLMGALKAIEGD